MKKEREKVEIIKKLFRKWYFWTAIIFITLSGALLIALWYVKSQPVSVIDTIDVSFGGYNHSGTAQLEGEYESKIKKTIRERKSANAAQYINDVTISLNKSKMLSNGQRILATVSTKIKDNPIKNEKREFIVKDLEEIPKIDNLEELLSSIDSRVRSNFSGNSAYSWDISRTMDVYFISGTIGDTNTGPDAEDKNSSVSPKAFSILAVYHFVGKGDISRDDDNYLIAGESNIEKDNNKINVNSIPESKHYWHIGDGSAQITAGFLEWYNMFASEQEVSDWLKTNYPTAEKINTV
ncbi:hypothetical protein QUW13_10970 [Enterococcus hirae]|nr:hypothetical protein [Enterococcus hirae]